MGFAAGTAGDERGAEAAYDALAPYYDDFTHFHEYDVWIGNLLPKLEARGLPARGRLLDVGCGTGKSFLPMLERGWEVRACDLSPGMVAIARGKVGPEVEISVADMRELPRFGAFDLVWTVDDAINYLLSVEQLERALAGLGRNLAADGLLLFDVNTLTTFRRFFAERMVVEHNGRRMTWNGLGSPDAAAESISEARFEVEPIGGGEGPALPPDLHRERHFPEAVVLAALRRAGLEPLDVYGHGEDGDPTKPLDESVHTKAVYIARLPH